MAALSEQDFESLDAIENPLDLIEELVVANSWQASRYNTDEMTVAVKGRWCEYRLHFLWREDLNALYFSSSFDAPIIPKRHAAVYELLARVNEKMWMGHFELCHDDLAILFRQTCLMRGQWGASIEQIEDLLDIALCECDRFYPAFQYVIGGGKDAEDALMLSMVDVMGAA